MRGGGLTPTLKVARNLVAQHWAGLIDETHPAP
jgi:hypothetical protein